MKVLVRVMNQDMNQFVAGEFVLVNGKIDTKIRPGIGNDRIMKGIFQETLFDGKNKIDPKRDPQRWLKALPVKFTGTGIRAELIK